MSPLFIINKAIKRKLVDEEDAKETKAWLRLLLPSDREHFHEFRRSFTLEKLESLLMRAKANESHRVPYFKAAVFVKQCESKLGMLKNHVAKVRTTRDRTRPDYFHVYPRHAGGEG